MTATAEVDCVLEEEKLQLVLLLLDEKDRLIAVLGSESAAWDAVHNGWAKRFVRRRVQASLGWQVPDGKKSYIATYSEDRRKILKCEESATMFNENGQIVEGWVGGAVRVVRAFSFTEAMADVEQRLAYRTQCTS